MNACVQKRLGYFRNPRVDNLDFSLQKDFELPWESKHDSSFRWMPSMF